MENKKKKGASWSVIFTMAAVLFGAEMGGGSASGANMMNFFVKVGWIGLWLCLISSVAEGWYFYWGNELARITKTRNYAAWLKELWHPIDKIMVPILDAFVFVTYLIFISVQIAGLATLLNTYYGVNYSLAVLIVTLLYVTLTIVGIKMIQNMGSTLTVIIVAAVLLVLAIGIPKFLPQVAEVQKNRTMGVGYTMLGGVWLAISHWGQQANILNVTVSTWTGMETKKDVKKAVIIGVTLLTIVKFGLTVLLQGRWPGNLGAPIYILEAANATGSAIISTIYPILLGACFLSTGPVMVFTQSERWSQHSFWDKMKDGNWFKKHKFAVCTIFFSTIGFLLAQFDFNTITGVILVWAAYLWVILFAVPVSILAPIQVRKLRKKEEAAVETEAKENVQINGKIVTE